MTDKIWDVAIVGYGPAGATLANLLGQAGLQVLVLERDANIYPLPRAIHFDGEVMRVFETIGLRREVQNIARFGLKGMHFNNAAGETMLIRGGTAEIGMHGCANNYYFHQPELEQVLRDGLRRFSGVEVRTRHEVQDIIDQSNAALLKVRDLQTDETYQVQARYVVGCDGARSLLRKVLGTTTLDLGLHQPWLVFDVMLKAEAPLLPAYTVQHCDPQRPMTLCNVTGQRRRWEIMLMPGDDPEQMVQPQTLWKLVSPWITPAQADIERAVIYTFHSLIAQGWRKGHLFLAGDAAHQTPPFLGQGMCAAVRDVANLAWKLEAVLLGRASEQLLDSYEAERSPHVHAFIELAVRLGDIIQITDPVKAQERDVRFKAGQPEIFEFPTPRLGPGVCCPDQPLAAQIFGQPVMDDGRRLDAHVGSKFAVLLEPALLGQVSESVRELWQAQNAAVLASGHAQVQSWLEGHGVRAVILRPDRYILGVARNAQELEAVSRCLPAAAACVQ